MKKGIPVRVTAHVIPGGKTYEFPEGTQFATAGATGQAGGAAIVLELNKDGRAPAKPVDVTDQMDALRAKQAKKADAGAAADAVVEDDAE